MARAQPLISGLVAVFFAIGGCACEQQILKPIVTLMPRRASPVPKQRPRPREQ